MPPGASPTSAVAVLCAIVCTAAVLRSPITSLGALSLNVQESFGLSAGAMGLLTTLPLLAFAASALCMSAIANRFGKHLVLAAGCALVAIGILLRSYLGAFGLFAGTIMLGLGISAGNVLLPAVAKDRFPAALGAATALYTTTMSVFAGGMAGLSATLVDGGLPWNGTLALGAPIAAAGAIIWFALRRRHHGRGRGREHAVQAPANRGSGRLLHPGIMRNPLTWWITGLFGLQSVLFYCTVAWLPSIFAARGISGGTIALCTVLFPVMGIVCTIFVPPLAQRLRRQRLLGAGIGALCTAGVALVALAQSDAAAIAATALFGFALGAPFCLCMFYFSARTANAADAARLSSIAQTFGYLLAAVGPACLGALFDATGSWAIPLIVLAALSAAQIICGWKSGTGRIPAQID